MCRIQIPVFHFYSEDILCRGVGILSKSLGRWSDFIYDRYF